MKDFGAPIYSFEDFDANRPTGRIVVTSGGFDPIHPGHISLLQESRKYGDVVVGLVNGDGFLRAKRGKPFQDLQTRCLIVSAVRFVDYVVPFEIEGDPTVCERDRPREIRSRECWPGFAPPSAPGPSRHYSGRSPTRPGHTNAQGPRPGRGRNDSVSAQDVPAPGQYIQASRPPVRRAAACTSYDTRALPHKMCRRNTSPFIGTEVFLRELRIGEDLPAAFLIELRRDRGNDPVLPEQGPHGLHVDAATLELEQIENGIIAIGKVNGVWLSKTSSPFWVSSAGSACMTLRP